MLSEIIHPPIGEAPSGVREGLGGIYVLPLARRRLRKWHGVGVTTGPKTFAGLFWACLTGQTSEVHGDAVNAKAAVDVLAGTNEAAAGWWRENSAHLLNGRKYFVFDSAACREAAPL